MRRIGGHVSTAGGVANALFHTSRIGGNCLQIFAGSPRTWTRAVYSDDVAANFRGEAVRLGFDPVYIHALYLTNLASADPTLRQKSIQALIIDMKNAAKIGARGVVLHVGSHQGRGFAEVKDVVLQEIHAVMDSTPDNVFLILENAAGQQGKIGSFGELQALSVVSPRIRFCLDTAHAFAAGYDLRTGEGRDRFVAEVASFLGWDNVELIHLNDSKADLGSGKDLHENLGAGKVGEEALRELLAMPELGEIPIILEVPGFDKQGPDADNIRIAKKLTEQ